MIDGYVLVERTYDDETLQKLAKTVERSVRRATKVHALRTDPGVYTPTVCRRGRLRYDMRLPPRSVADCNVLPAVQQLVDQSLGGDHIARPPHCLVAFAGAEAQSWHTDVDALFEDHPDVTTPSFYLTLITALEDVIDEAMGPTEFEDGFKATLKRNESILFDGLAVHRGGAAAVDRPPLLYRVFHRRWYTDANERG